MSIPYNTFVTGLPSATTPLTGSESLAIVQGGVTVKVPVSNIAIPVALPGTIPDLQFWWESDDIVGAAGAVISRLRERTPWIGGLAASASSTGQATVAIDATPLNGLPVLVWPANAVSGMYAIPSPVATTSPGACGFYFNKGATYFVVAKGSSSATTQAITGGATSALSLFLVPVAGTAKIGLVKTGVSVIGSSTATWVAGTFFQANATYNPATGAYAFRQAQAAAGSGTGATSAGSTGGSITNLLGGDLANTSFLNSASLAAVIAYNRILSGAEILSVEAYLNTKWGV